MLVQRRAMALLAVAAQLRALLGHTQRAVPLLLSAPRARPASLEMPQRRVLRVAQLHAALGIGAAQALPAQLEQPPVARAPPGGIVLWAQRRVMVLSGPVAQRRVPLGPTQRAVPRLLHAHHAKRAHLGMLQRKQLRVARLHAALGIGAARVPPARLEQPPVAAARRGGIAFSDQQLAMALLGVVAARRRVPSGPTQRAVRLLRHAHRARQVSSETPQR